MPILKWPVGDPIVEPMPEDARTERPFAWEDAPLAVALARVQALERTSAALMARVAEMERQVKDLRTPPFQPILP
jgi:hypothetical protein